MIEIKDFVEVASADLDLPELLKQPISVLIGVSDEAAAALKAIGIETVFDLGCSRVFRDARTIVSPHDVLGSGARQGLVPGDLVIDGTNVDALEDAAILDISTLRSLSQAQADALSDALSVSTIADFSRWPPYMFASRLVAGTLGGVTDIDLQHAEKLRPAFGEFPTERVYYSTLAMLELNEPPQDGLKPLDGGVPIDPELGAGAGFTRPAVGAMLTYSQSWYVQGITFGHLLHSLALAPGEATRIAIVDWSRRTRATSTESISETEQLDSATSHARAISEVQNAVASEMQQGGSMTSSHSSTDSYSGQVSVGTGLLTSLWASGDASGSYSGASTDTTASSSSWSLGNRSVGASMAQNINDRTEQHSTSARNRRATAVREVSQSEHEQISTRIVANYNHMHALTVQYYEIVQVYRVATRLHQAERCLFIPMQRLDFTEPKGSKYVERFRGALLRAALNGRVRELLSDDAAAVEIRATSATVVGPLTRPDLRPSVANIRALSRVAEAARSTTAAAAATERLAEAATGPAASAAAAAASPTVAALHVWDRSDIAVAARILNRPLVRHGSDSLFLPDDTELLAISFDGLTVSKLRLDRIGENAADTELTAIAGRIDLPTPVRLSELDGIYASRAEGSAGSGRMTLLCSYLGRRLTLPAIPVELGTAMAQVARLRTDQADRRRELLTHLQANSAHYTSAILRSLDSPALVLLLSEYEWNGRPVIEQVEPKPLAVAGNYLVLRAPVDSEENSGVANSDGTQIKWGKLLGERGFDLGAEPNARIVPIPTNGVFAEAVLGRSNSAEKLEYTRFWNWQDSPIPLTPPEIAPVSAGSRGTDENLTPGQLGTPVINLVTPTTLPDPAGLGAVLTAVSNGNMFRDMSGLVGTQQLAGQVAQGTIDAATAAGEITSANMRAQMQKAVAMGQIAADIAKTAMGMPSSGGSNQSVTAEAARVSHGEQRDKITGASGEDGGASPNIGGGGSGGSSGGNTAGGGPVGTQAVFASSGGGAGDAAFRRALWGPMGEPLGEIANNALAMANTTSNATSAPAGGGGGGGGASSNASPFSTKVYPTPMVPDASHNARLAAAITAEKQNLSAAKKAMLDKAAILVTRLTPSGPMQYAGIHEDEMYFSGSLLKTTLLYASFELVNRVNAIAPSIAASSAADFFSQIEQALGAKIAAAVPQITTGDWQKVAFDKALEAVPIGQNFAVKMGTTHRADVERIFADQNQNFAARDCMHRLGFSYVNGANDAAGFFGVVTQKGIWMATDYIKDDPPAPGNWRSFNIPVVTGSNGTSSAAMTCLSMANLLTQIHRKELINQAASQEMRAIFRRGGAWLSLLPAATIAAKSFAEDGAKVGHASSASANVGSVKSEAAFLKRKSDNAEFVAVWQNVPDALDHPPIYNVIDEVIKTWP